MRLAVEGADFGIWIRGLARNEIWATDKWRALFGFTKAEPLEIDQILERLHPELARLRVRQAARAPQRPGLYRFRRKVLLQLG